MRQFVAVLIDSFRESVDRTALLVLCCFSLLFILYCFGFSFDVRPRDRLLTEQAENLHEFRASMGGMGTRTSTLSKAHEAGEVRPVTPADGLPVEFEGAHLVEISFSGESDADRYVKRWRVFGRGPFNRSNDEEGEDGEGGEDEITETDRIEFLRERFESEGWSAVHVEPVDAARADPPVEGEPADGEPVAYRIAVGAESLKEVNGAYRVSRIFGLWKSDSPSQSVAQEVVSTQIGIANVALGNIGILVAILCTAGFIPSMLRKGSLDLVLARPIGRTRLLLFKYLGGLWFLFLVAAFLVGGCWVGLAIRTGYASPYFLGTALVATALFAVLYAVGTLFGVLFRSAPVAGLLTIGVWWISSSIVTVKNMLQFTGADEAPEWLREGIDILYVLAPATSDFGVLNSKILARSQLSDEARQRLFASVQEVDWALSFGSTAVFTLVVLAFAVTVFRRRDF